MNKKLPPIIAVVGSDGSGKSTVCEQLLTYIKKYGPAENVHLGKQAGNTGRAIAELPIIGRFIGKEIDRNAKKIKKEKTKVTLLPALVITFFVIRRLRRFRRMLALHQQGNIILTDRFPQMKFLGGFDGPVFPISEENSAFVNWLAKKERKAFTWMTSHKPDLVIKLHVDLDVACARKPDHERESLARKIEMVPKLTFEGADIADIDTNQPLDVVCAAAEEAVAKLMVAHGYALIQ